MFAFPIRFLIRSVYPVSRSRLVIVVVCGIPCRLAHRLVPPSRSVVSFPVCFFFRFRLGASRLSSRSLFSLLRLVVLLLFACFRFLTHSVRLRLRPRSSSSLSSSSSSSFVSCSRCLTHFARPFVLAIVSRHCVALASSALPIAFPSMSHMKRHAHDVPSICSLGRLPLTITIGEQMGN